MELLKIRVTANPELSITHYYVCRDDTRWYLFEINNRTEGAIKSIMQAYNYTPVYIDELALMSYKNIKDKVIGAVVYKYSCYFTGAEVCLYGGGIQYNFQFTSEDVIWKY